MKLFLLTYSILLVKLLTASCLPSTGLAAASSTSLSRQRYRFFQNVAALRGGSSVSTISHELPLVDDVCSVPPPPQHTAEPILEAVATEEEVVNTVWARHRRWSLAASRQKRKIRFYQNTHLSLMVTGAFFQTLAARYHTSKYGWFAALIGGGCLGAAPLIGNTFLSKESKSDWIRCRAISEQIKAQVFHYRAGVPPYDVVDPIQALVNRVADISEGAKDLRVHYVVTQPDDKKAPLKLDRAGYIKYRLKTQKDDFYIRTAREKAKASSQLKGCQAVLSVASSLMGIVAGSAGGAAASIHAGSGGDAIFSHLARNIGIWGATLATAASAFGSHVVSGKFDDQVMERSIAAQRLENLFLRLPQSIQPGSPEWTTFVLQCEEVIASNSQQWANLLGLSSAKINDNANQ